MLIKKAIYVFLVALLTLLLVADYVPFLSFCTGWVTPPVSLLCGLLFDLLVG